MKNLCIRVTGLTLLIFHNTTRKMHFKCINNFYPKTENKVRRAFVPEKKIPWNEPYPEYTPFEYTAPRILALPSFADPDINDSNFSPKWNDTDGKISRKSHETVYEIVSGRPRNYKGRTGITGRGLLGRWGPNHAADPIVTRWKLNENQSFVESEESGKKILQFISIERRDCGEWAIPGGMVDPGEKITSTLQREFMEEALNSHEMSNVQKHEARKELQQLFDHGTEIYSGYVDDPRNTDNAWMETVAYNFHDDLDGILYKLKLVAGDDARSVKWIDLSQNLKLYASHKEILARVSQKLNAHW